MELVQQIRTACAWVAAQSTHVRINESRLPDYAAWLRAESVPEHQSTQLLAGEDRERAAAYWLTLNAVNFGSGWFPTLLKMPGMTGYRTIKAGVDRRFKDDGPWSAAKLQRITMAEISTLMMQEPHHPLMPLFKASLRDLGVHIERDYDGSFAAVLEAAGDSAVQLVQILAGWDCFADSSEYAGRTIPFLKRAQIAAADLQRAQAVRWTDGERLTLFADNLVPHVLRLDGVLEFEPRLVQRIDAGELIEHGSPEEVEMRACAVEAVERLSRSCGRAPWMLDELLWNRGQLRRYKSVPRPRSRSTAY